MALGLGLGGSTLKVWGLQKQKPGACRTRSLPRCGSIARTGRRGGGSSLKLSRPGRGAWCWCGERDRPQAGAGDGPTSAVELTSAVDAVDAPDVLGAWRAFAAERPRGVRAWCGPETAWAEATSSPAAPRRAVAAGAR